MVQITDDRGDAVELGHRPTTRLHEFEAAAVIAERREAAEGVVELVLQRRDELAWPQWKAGAHIDLILPDGLVRQYSLCGVHDDPRSWRIGILREPESRGGSSYVHDELYEGKEVHVRGPRNAFRLGEADTYIFIAGGIGITPILAMIEEVRRKGKDWVLHYGGRTRSSMAFLEELAAMGGDVRLYPQDEVGFIPLPEILGTPTAGVGIYACGHGPMLGAVEAFTETWPAGSIHMERFAVDEAELKHADDQPIELYLETSGISVNVGAGETILEAVEREGIGVLSSCKVGTCGTCEAPVLEGEPDHRDSVLDEEERAANDCMMICVSRAKSRRLVLDL
jgi:ferredoxin-NADP reductase